FLLDLHTGSFFFAQTTTTDIYTLSLHDALPICSVKLAGALHVHQTRRGHQDVRDGGIAQQRLEGAQAEYFVQYLLDDPVLFHQADRKSTRLNSSHRTISYAVFCLKKKN